MTTTQARQVMYTELMVRGKNMEGRRHCRLCEGNLTVGEKIVTKKAGRYTSWYHVGCARKVNII